MFMEIWADVDSSSEWQKSLRKPCEWIIDEWQEFLVKASKVSKSFPPQAISINKTSAKNLCSNGFEIIENKNKFWEQYEIRN
jgi:hypothetical protein